MEKHEDLVRLWQLGVYADALPALHARRLFAVNNPTLYNIFLWLSAHRYKIQTEPGIIQPKLTPTLEARAKTFLVAEEISWGGGANEIDNLVQNLVEDMPRASAKYVLAHSRGNTLGWLQVFGKKFNNRFPSMTLKRCIASLKQALLNNSLEIAVVVLISPSLNSFHLYNWEINPQQLSILQKEGWECIVASTLYGDMSYKIIPYLKKI